MKNTKYQKSNPKAEEDKKQTVPGTVSTIRSNRIGCGLGVLLLGIWALEFGFCQQAWADEKRWTGRGDQSSWDDAANWTPEDEPGAGDDVTLDKHEAAATVDRSFDAKSITVGGNEPTELTVDEFISGTVEPDASTENAVINRRAGQIRLVGPGTVKLRGTYRDSEESLAPEPSFMITLA